MAAEAKTFDAEEVLARRDLLAEDEITRDALERERAAGKIRYLEEEERRLLADQPEVLARREAARRRLCREHYLPFVMRFNPDYNAGWVHKDICRRLEKFSADVANKLSPRLMLTMPPRHGKSTLTSKTFGAWHLGRYPRHEIMTCSYSGSLSMGFSRNVRQIMRDPAYATLFDTRLDPDSQSAEAWLTADGGGFTSAGIGGAITGKGAHVMVIDDPVKNREDAESETSRKNAIDWYTSTAYTRLAPGGGILIILTRWHDGDLAGYLLDAMDEGADQWELINYPAIAEYDEEYRDTGEALHPARYDEVALARIKRAVGNRDWGALYQQNPVPDEGAYFKKKNLRTWTPDTLPPADELVEYTAWDLAVGTRQVNDFSVGITVSIDMNMNIYVREVNRLKVDSEQLVDEILSQHRRWPGTQRTGIEKGVIEMSIGPFMKRIQRERGHYDFAWSEMKPGKMDKVARARTIQGMTEAGKVFIPQDAPWLETFVNELLRFPSGVHDDCVDSFAYIGKMLMLMAPVVKAVEKKPSWKDKIQHLVSSGDVHSRKSAMSA